VVSSIQSGSNCCFNRGCLPCRENGYVLGDLLFDDAGVSRGTAAGGASGDPARCRCCICVWRSRAVPRCAGTAGRRAWDTGRCRWPISSGCWRERTGFVTAVAWPLMLTRCMSWPPTRMRRGCSGCSMPTAPRRAAGPCSSPGRRPACRSRSATIGARCCGPPPTPARSISGLPSMASARCTTGR